jgi:hypothetical protein
MVLGFRGGIDRDFQPVKPGCQAAGMNFIQHGLTQAALLGPWGGGTLALSESPPQQQEG